MELNLKDMEAPKALHVRFREIVETSGYSTPTCMSTLSCNYGEIICYCFLIGLWFASEVVHTWSDNLTKNVTDQFMSFETKNI